MTAALHPLPTGAGTARAARGALAVPGADASLAPVRATIRVVFGTDRLPGLAPGLTVDEPAGWLPATALTGGEHLDDLLASAERRWRSTPHTATALAWKAYTYWLALAPVLGWAGARRVPLMGADEVLLRLEPSGPSGPFVTVGLRPGATVAVLANDPLAIAPRPEIKVVDDEAALLSALRAGLLDAHLNPLLDRVRGRVRLGARTLMGSLASGIAHALLRAADALPGSAVEAVDTVLGALDLADLVELMPDQAGRPTVQRKTCCLAFTLPKPRVCAGCCIRPTP